MTFMGLFKRRRIGPLSVSPVGLVVFILLAAVAGIIASRVFEAKELQENIYAAKNFAYPIAAQARLIQEQTGKWPAALAEIEAAKAKAPPQIARTEMGKDGEVRVVFANPPSIANATLNLKVIVRGGEHFLECRGVGEFKGALPSACRPGEGPERVAWPPDSAK
jgi:hypothetical protein